MAYNGLGAIYMLQNKVDKAEKCFLKVIELNSSDTGAYLNLGKIYERRQDIKQAGKYYEKVVELDPRDVGGCLELAWVCKNQGKFSEAEELMKKAIEASPEEERRNAAMEILYREMGNLELSKEYRRKAEELIKKFYQPETAANYLRLKGILDKRNIKYICMQYPMRSIEPLKRIFNAEKGIVFVDNERVFGNAVEKEGYNEYFDDMFGGDFGHCTLKGNRLIAENAANIILKDCFNK
jgi:tetratricopeptide (TPR) repeat protein